MRAHSGWAVIVAVADDVPVLRRRIEIAPGTGMRARQPYHAAAEMKLDAAQPFLLAAEAKSVQMASAAIREILAELQGRGYAVKRAAVLLGSGKPLPVLEKILAAHPLIHTAEGVFFRNVLRTACGGCHLAIQGIPEREVAPELLQKAASMGKVLGPPWTMDEKLSAAAALYILSIA
jgi:hypothetical protein